MVIQMSRYITKGTWYVLKRRVILNLYLFSNQKLFDIHWYTFNWHSTFIWEVPTCHCNFFQQCPYWECVDLCCNIHQDIVTCKNMLILIYIMIIQVMRKTNKRSFNQAHIRIFHSVVGSYKWVDTNWFITLARLQSNKWIFYLPWMNKLHLGFQNIYKQRIRYSNDIIIIT